MSKRSQRIVVQLDMAERATVTPAAAAAAVVVAAASASISDDDDETKLSGFVLKTA